MKKRILTESSTKRFMKLASIGALSDKFINETKEETMEESEETVTETEDPSLEEGGMYKKDDKVEENIEETVEENVEENIEETTELTEAETVNVDVVELVDSILSAVSDATGVEMSREGGEEELGAEEGEPELGDDPVGDDPMGDGPVEDPELGGEELPADDPAPEEEEEEMDAMMQEKFINEVTRRVAQRLLKKLGKS